MSKELTEKWRNGTLPENWYYIHLKSDWGGIDCITINYCDEDGVFEEYPDEDIKEVVAPVPSYDEYNEFMQKIHILEKQLSSISEQLKEANDVIKKYRRFEVALKVEKGTLIGVYPAIDYLEKWGVK